MENLILRILLIQFIRTYSKIPYKIENKIKYDLILNAYAFFYIENLFRRKTFGDIIPPLYFFYVQKKLILENCKNSAEINFLSN